MILYFSGSGNNKFIANYINKTLNDEVISLNEVIKFNKPLEFNSSLPYLIITPIYAWRYPLIIEDLIKKANFNGNNKIYFIASMGQNSGDAQKYLKEIALNKKMEYMGYSKVIMPSNYVVSEKAISNDEAIKIINDALPIINNLALLIKNNQKFDEPKKEHFGKMYSSFINYGFNKYFKSSKNFKVSDSCIKCKKCIEVCPLNNVSLVNNKITFSTNCMFCLSCMNHCPINAITYNNKKNGTYLFDNLNFEVDKK